MPDSPGINKSVLAENYGFSMALLNSNPELKKLFSTAVKETWAPDRFIAGVHNTKWYRKTAEPARQAQVLAKTDPATYKLQVSQSASRVRLSAGEIGAVVSSATVNRLAQAAFTMGWDDNQLRQHLGSYVKWTDGRMLGQAGQWATQIKDHVAAMGVAYNSKSIDNQIRSIVKGGQTIDDVLNKITETAASKYPHLAARLRQGETVEDIAEPYRQQAAQTLEMEPGQFKVSGTYLSRALQDKDKKGNFTLMPMYDFENTLRKDSRWRKTDNAKEAAASVTNDLLKNMGLVS